MTIYGERFAITPEWVLDAEVSDRAVRLWAVLNRFAGEKGEANPGRLRIAKRLRCSEKSVDRAMRELVQIGAVVAQAAYDDAGDRTANDYYLWPKTPVTRGGATVDPTGGDATDPRGGATADEVRRAMLKESHVEGDIEGEAVPAPKAKRATPFPDPFTITEAMNDWTRTNARGVDIIAETEQFADYHRAKGSTMKDWEAAWRTWMRNAAKWRTNGARAGPVHKPERGMAAVEAWGREKGLLP